MTLDKFCYHIASHGCVYSRADIQAILILAVDCLREQLLNGQQIQMGDLGVFSNSIRSLGAPSMAEFTVENITEVLRIPHLKNKHNIFQFSIYYDTRNIPNDNR